MKIAIVGFGREGQSILKALKNYSSSKNSEIWILDENSKTKTPKGINKQLGKNYLKNLDSFDIVFRSPGIPYLLPEFIKARKNGVKFSSATKLFFAHCPGTIIGITGTKGKGTTATLLYQILKSAKKDVYLVGNIGTKDWLNLLPEMSKNSSVVFELSSFQLQDLTQSPHLAIILDIDVDHLDHHRNIKEYVESKSNISRFQTKNDFVFYWPENKSASKIAQLGKAKKIKLSAKNFNLFFKNDLYLPAPHQFKNAIAATETAKKLGIKESVIKKTVKEFRGLKFRLEHLTTKNGIKYYNDSASTNPHATIAALQAFQTPFILIAGGRNKGASFKQLGQAIDNSLAQEVILIGESQALIAKEIKRTPVSTANTLREALQKAEDLACSGDSILFSPACSSFDMFKNYVDRSQQFEKLVAPIVY